MAKLTKQQMIKKVEAFERLFEERWRESMRLSEKMDSRTSIYAEEWKEEGRGEAHQKSYASIMELRKYFEDNI